jgi:serine/threonine protein kinase
MNKLNKSHEALIERSILSDCNHPNIIKLLSTFHDKEKLYYVLEYCPNRDLSSFLRSQGILSFEMGRFYAAEIVNALEYLQNKNIAHRDLKPENMVLDSNMHIKIVKIKLFFFYLTFFRLTFLQQ